MYGYYNNEYHITVSIKNYRLTISEVENSNIINIWQSQRSDFIPGSAPWQVTVSTQHTPYPHHLRLVIIRKHDVIYKTKST